MGWLYILSSKESKSSCDNMKSGRKLSFQSLQCQGEMGETLVLFQYMSEWFLVLALGGLGNSVDGSLKAVSRLRLSCDVSLVGSITGTCKGSAGSE